MEAGVDSLAATELASRLRVLTGITLSPTLVFEHPTPRAIAAHLLEQVGGGAGGVVSPVCIAADATAALALVGAAGRWPGGCNDDASRWHLASACGNGVSSVPSVRWTLELVVDTSTLSAVQAACVRHGGFLAGAELFAHAAFGVSRAEASAMDPQQRLLLESGYASLHCSGARRSLLMGGDGGVFLGIERPDWAIAMPGPSRASVYAVTGDNVSVAAGRLSFVLGMQGPCSSIDTACASGVAALHGAGHAVRAGECSRAVTLAVSLKLMPYGSLGCASAGMLSVDGRCKTFDARANGYARSEGLSSVAILRDVAECVVLLASSAVRQDGRSASLTAPNGSAQRTLLMAALGRASRDAAEVSTIEAHGTGTPLGDPTEAGALSAVHSSVDRPSPLCISSAKANVGHAEAPSGLVGLLKARLHLLDAACFANAHLREPNPLVIERLGGLGESVCTFLLPQHAIAGSRLTRTCGLSSFGFSGTISHCLLAASTLVAAWCSSSPVRFVRSLFAWHGSGITDGTTLAAVGVYALCWSATSLPVASRTTAAEGLVLGRHGVLMAGAGHASASWRIVVVLMDAAAQAAPSMLGSELVLHLGQQLSREVHRARLVVVTCGTQAASMVMSSSSAAHGGVWGLLRVLRLEHASLRPLSVDAAAGCVAGTADASGVVLADAAGAEAELASSGAACWHAARLRRGLADAGSALDVSGQFVITGGLGGLGLRAASLLADHGATGVVLASRSGHVARDGQALFFQLASLCSASSVLSCAADASNQSEVVHLSLRRFLQAGFLHLASIFDARLVAHPSASSTLRRHIAGPKPTGAVALHHACSTFSLQISLYLSSLAALAMTSAVYRGLAAYSAANLYVDGLSCISCSVGRLSCSLQMANVAEQGSGALIAQNLVYAPGTVRISLAQYTATLAASILFNVSRAACCVLPTSMKAVLHEFEGSSRTLVGEYDQVVNSCALERRLSMTDRLVQFKASICALDQAVYGPIPTCPTSAAAVVVVGCGLTGLILASAFAKVGDPPLVIEKARCVGGVWRWYSNPHSRVNSTEPCYRLNVQREQPNTNHSYCHEILDDIRRAVEQNALAPRIHLNSQVMSVQRDQHCRYGAQIPPSYGHTCMCTPAHPSHLSCPTIITGRTISGGAFLARELPTARESLSIFWRHISCSPQTGV